MQLDYHGSLTLKETVRWSRFLAIVGFIGLGVCILAILTASSVITPMIQRYYGFNSAGLVGVAVGFSLIVLSVLVVLVVMLYRFSVFTRRGIETQDQVLFNNGLNSLKVYFLISGVLGIISLISTIYNTIAVL